MYGVGVKLKLDFNVGGSCALPWPVRLGNSEVSNNCEVAFLDFARRAGVVSTFGVYCGVYGGVNASQ